MSVKQRSRRPSTLSRLLRKYVGLGKQEDLTTASSSDPLPLALALHASIFVYALAYWLTQPVLPYLTKTFAADPVVFGQLQSLFSLMQILGGMFIGGLSKNPHFGMALTLLGSAASYFLLCAAASIGTALLPEELVQKTFGRVFGSPGELSSSAVVSTVGLALIFASRLPTALMATMQVAQSLLGGHGAVALGRLSLSYGLGMIGGSAAGGFLAAGFGHAFTTMLAGGLSLVVGVLWALVASGRAMLGGEATASSSTRTVEAPKGGDEKAFGATGGSVTVEKRPPAGKNSSPATVDGAVDKNSSYFQLLKNSPKLRQTLLLQLVAGFGIAVHVTTASSIAIHTFAFPQEWLGAFMSLKAGLGVFANVFLVGPVVARFSKNAGKESRGCHAAVGSVSAVFVAFAVFGSVAVGAPGGEKGTENWVLASFVVLSCLVALHVSLFYTLSTSAINR